MLPRMPPGPQASVRAATAMQLLAVALLRERYRAPLEDLAALLGAAWPEAAPWLEGLEEEVVPWAEPEEQSAVEAVALSDELAPHNPRRKRGSQPQRAAREARTLSPVVARAA